MLYVDLQPALRLLSTDNMTSTKHTTSSWLGRMLSFQFILPKQQQKSFLPFLGYHEVSTSTPYPSVPGCTAPCLLLTIHGSNTCYVFTQRFQSTLLENIDICLESGCKEDILRILVLSDVSARNPESAEAIQWCHFLYFGEGAAFGSISIPRVSSWLLSTQQNQLRQWELWAKTRLVSCLQTCARARWFQ